MRFLLLWLTWAGVTLLAISTSRDQWVGSRQVKVGLAIVGILLGVVLATSSAIP
jgi:hypothetical protein